MPFYAPGGLKFYIQAILQEGKEFEDSLPSDYPRNLTAPEEIKVVFAAMGKKRGEVQSLHAYLVYVRDSHLAGNYVGTVIEYMLSVKHLLAVHEYLAKLNLWIKELETLLD